MPMFTFKKLTVFFIVAALLLVPLSAVAHDVTFPASQDACACQIMTTACSPDDSGKQPDQCPGNNAGDCCDNEECGHETTEPPVGYGVKVNVFAKQLFSTDSQSHIPKVYLAIFIPPER